MTHDPRGQTPADPASLQVEQVTDAMHRAISSQSEFLSRMPDVADDLVHTTRRLMAAQGDYLTDLSRCRDLDDVARANITFLTRTTNDCATGLSHLTDAARRSLRVYNQSGAGRGPSRRG
jgi:hypothetical protein